MSIDNSTGKKKDFYEAGKRQFDRIEPLKPTRPYTQMNVHTSELEYLRAENKRKQEIIDAMIAAFHKIGFHPQLTQHGIELVSIKRNES
jgi:hypothetical protein